MELHHSMSQSIKDDMVYCTGFENPSEQSVFWSLLSPDQDLHCARVEASLSLSFRPKCPYNWSCYKKNTAGLAQPAYKSAYREDLKERSARLKVSPQVSEKPPSRREGASTTLLTYEKSKEG